LIELPPHSQYGHFAGLPLGICTTSRDLEEAQVNKPLLSLKRENYISTVAFKVNSSYVCREGKVEISPYALFRRE
jgi:hypothetical protein